MKDKGWVGIFAAFLSASALLCPSLGHLKDPSISALATVSPISFHKTQLQVPKDDDCPIMNMGCRPIQF